jgi:hypothetical protein|tara:strand:- start:2032 stop:2235 length:204 start_codon:yes stop_codon:yes gene_type:complete
MSRLNPALQAYLNLPDVEEDEVVKDVSGLLGKRKLPFKKTTEGTPVERVARYVASIKKARMELTDGK